MSPIDFFSLYKDWAIETQSKSGVPASITLAQAAIESAYGESSLTKKANNFFGIKTAGYPLWFGEHVLAFDVLPDQKFRKYATPYDSFIDHADFLKLNKRYRSLFENTNYRDWANGLQTAGYAEATNYSQSLINIIENYSLDQYDVIGNEEMKSVTNTIIRNKYNIYRIIGAILILVALFFVGRKVFKVK